MTELANRAEADLGTIERVIAVGDLSRLSADERSRYYVETCSSLRLNPLTQPFQYITLNSRLTLYATRAATDQLRALHHVSIQIVSSEVIGDLYVVRARASLPDGRTDEEIGAVAIGGLKGEALANAWMKANTKAKRRVTLAIVGLGWLDESEIDTIPDARRHPFDHALEVVPSPEPPPAAIGSPPEPSAPAGESPRMRAVRAEMDAAVAEAEVGDSQDSLPLVPPEQEITSSLWPEVQALAAELGQARVNFQLPPAWQTEEFHRQWLTRMTRALRAAPAQPVRRAP